MSRWYAYRRWVYTALVVLLVLDAGVYFGWVQRPPMAPELSSTAPEHAPAGPSSK